MTDEEILTKYGPREAMEYDVVVGGGGAAGLSCAIRQHLRIKDPTRNIVWVTPEGGGGPNYGNM